ncbi:MAG: cupin domain-containing protein [bacterium]|nr:cupin domain-containing protein [bacterium]
MKPIIFKKKSEAHFVKKWDDGSESDRIVLPGSDDCLVKVTMFRPKAGFSAENVVYACDETVHMVSGRTEILLADGSVVELRPGDTYYAPAGNPYGLRALEDGEMFCVFSSAGDGTLPDNT